MEFAVYKIRYRGHRKLGTFVNMFSAREEAEELAEKLDGEHQVVELWTRELTEDDDYSTVLFFDEAGVVALAPPEVGGSR